MLVTPERRMSSCVMTYTAAGASDRGSGRFETEVTSMFINSSMPSSVKSDVRACAAGPAARPESTASTPVVLAACNGHRQRGRDHLRFMHQLERHRLSLQRKMPPTPRKGL